jgi:hypothetical protein
LTRWVNNVPSCGFVVLLYFALLCFALFAEPMVQTMETAGVTLEATGRMIMMRTSLAEIGGSMAACGSQLEQLSAAILELSPEESNGQLSSQRMAYAAEKMTEAGNELMGTPKTKPKGKGWLKG